MLLQAPRWAVETAKEAAAELVQLSAAKRVSEALIAAEKLLELERALPITERPTTAVKEVKEAIARLDNIEPRYRLEE